MFRQSTRPTTAPSEILPTIRVYMQQPTLAKYRVPVYRELARRPGIRLLVHFGQNKAIPNVPAEGFEAVPYNPTSLPGPLREFKWNALPSSLVKSSSCDVAILNWNIRHLSLLPALLWTRFRGIPTLVWGHGYSKQEGPMKRWLRWSVSRLCQGIIVYSHNVADDLTRAGFDRHRIFVAQNTIDQSEIQAARQHWLDRPADLQAFREQHRLDQGPRLLFVSRLEHLNRTDILLQAMAILRQHFPTISATIVGDGEAAPALKALAKQLNLQDNVRFTGAIYKDLDLAPWFLSSDVFVYPSNIGLSLLHAFGFGLPVVVGNTMHLHGPEVEALRPGSNGLTFEHNNPRELARELQNLLSNPERLKAMAHNALTTARDEFTLKRMVDGVESAIRFAKARPVVETVRQSNADPQITNF
ncbi:MAG: glycosyltransferase family 4 protein [Phycisphaerales bacterium]|nr:glycosyltransferase family 4 protein [Phycisphaerales bacterium]